MKHLFIINPAAGSHNQTESYRKKIAEVCETRKLEYAIEISGAPGQCRAIANRVAKTGEEYRIYSCGGDGTMNEIVGGIAGYENVAVTMFAGGSGNDFIRIFGDKKALRDVKDHINGTVMDFDLIKCGDEYAINQCSKGLDAEVCARQASLKKLPFVTGEMAYTLGVLTLFVGKMHKTFTIKIDDEEEFTANVLFCLAANSRWYGGGYFAAPKDLTYDGELDFVIVKKDCMKLYLLYLLGQYKKGKHLDWERTVFRRGKKITIKSDEESAVNIDGEVRFGKETTFEIVEKGIKFVVPACSDFMERVKNNNV
jgi:YegS/Rv2252/BmrU family lipid kinase